MVVRLKIFGDIQRRKEFLNSIIIKNIQENTISFESLLNEIFRLKAPYLPSSVFREAILLRSSDFKHYKNLSFIKFNTTSINRIIGMLAEVSKIFNDLEFKAKITHIDQKIEILYKAGNMLVPRNIDCLNELVKILCTEPTEMQRIKFNLIIKKALVQLARALEFKEFEINVDNITQDAELIGLWDKLDIHINIRNYAPRSRVVRCTFDPAEPGKFLGPALLLCPFLLKEELQKYYKEGDT